MKHILIPVKNLAGAKQRLAALMSQKERTAMAYLMMERLFDEVAKARGHHRVSVVTLYEPAIAMATGRGFEIIRENQQISESVSVDYASRILSERGAHSVLRVPIDLPLISAEDIETMLLGVNEREPSVLLVPSRDGTGTNAIARTPPNLFPSHFGPGSLLKHMNEARRQAAPYKLLRLPRVECDVDDAADLAYVAKAGGSCIEKFLSDLGIEERFRRFASGRA